MIVSKYRTAFDKIKVQDLTIDQYIEIVKNGETRSMVESAREAKNNGFPDEYKKLKSKLPCITGSAVMNSSGRSKTNIEKLNGLIVIDIDEDIDSDQIETLKGDKYTFILHRSVGGDGVCIFVKINPGSFLICFNELAEYYFENYDIRIDQACKDQTRLRYISYDADIFVNPSAQKYKNVGRKEKPTPIIENCVFLQTDFDDIVRSITSRKINITESYEEYFNIACAISSQFGAGGMDYFKSIASCSSKYNSKHAEKTYNICCSRSNSGISISTFYYYAKEAGVEIYSDRTKQIVNVTTAGKANKDKTGISIESTIESLNNKGIIVTKEEQNIIDQVWNSTKNYGKEINKDVPKVLQIRDFIIDSYDPYFDTIRNVAYIKSDKEVSDNVLNDVYIDCNTVFDWGVTMQDINIVLGSSAVRNFDPVSSFFDVNVDDIKTGFIDKYIDCILTESEEVKSYNKWAFTKWLVGAVHNWTCDYSDPYTCPLTLVISGKQGSGKTQFFRELYPNSLKNYCLEERINGEDKDSKLKLGQSLILVDEEFGGMAIKDAKAYKALSDLQIVEIRRPYKRTSEKFRRRSILGGTTNDIDILKDVTGNRRILPIDGTHIDFKGIKSIKADNIWLEAYKLLKDGFEWKIYTDEDVSYLEDNTDRYKTVDPFEEKFFDVFKLEESNDFNIEVVLNQGDVLTFFNTNTMLRPNKYEIKDIFIKNKMQYKPHRVKNSLKKGYKLYRQHNQDDVLPF